MSTLRNTLTTSMTLATVSLLSSAIASAQPSTQPVPAAAPPPAPIYQPVAPTQAPAPAPVARAEPSPAATVEVADAPVTARPQGLTFGLGLGYFLNGSFFDNGPSAPVDIQSPTGASVQVRMPSGLTLAPFLRLATHGQSQAGGDTKDAQNEFIVGSEVRYPLKGRGKVDLVAVGTAALAIQGDDPDSDNNNSTLTGFAVGYGLSVEYWYSANWRLSFTATNPIFLLNSRSFEVSDDLTTTDIDVGVIWDPDTNLALHLFF